MLNNRNNFNWLLPLAAIISLLLAGCKFDTAVLDERRCTDDNECQQGFRCIDNVCQGTGGLADIVEDADVVDEEIDLCTDFDEDSFEGGPGCDAEPFDCNDFDPSIYPGADEICDDKDNDCDGLKDTEDTEDYIEVECALTEGVCAGTLKACVGGELQDCTAETYGDDYAEVEEGNVDLCDGEDNDCDGDTDEISRSCFSTELGVDDPALDHAPCRLGTQTCTGDDTWSTCADEIVPVGEICDPTGVDDDCDGVIDDGCTCIPGQVASCFNYGEGLTDDALDHPPCIMGTMLCGPDGTYQDCIGERLPSTETCGNPGIDDDCDGDNAATDIAEDLPSIGTVNWGQECSVSGAQGACIAGHYRCGATGLECVSDLVAVPESCANVGVDNDCDGQNSDAEFPGLNQPCKADGVDGECRFGTLVCSSGNLVCQASSPTANDGDDFCDDLDNDCDGLVDNDVDFAYSEQNCGACSADDATNNCATDGDDDTTTCCEGDCVDITADENNCGGCPNDTDTGSRGDDCFADTSLTTPGCCGSACTDLDIDFANCGGCTVDDATNNCANDANDVTDVQTGVTSDANACCAGGCVDTEIDELNCGGCGITCDANTEQCCSGECVPLDDPDDCGLCGTVCTENTQACCAAPEPVGATDPPFVCVDLWETGVNPAVQDNCGGCAVDCNGAGTLCCNQQNEAGTSLLGIGACVDSSSNVDYCGPDCEDCNGNPTDGEFSTMDCCDGACTDLLYDEDNCGACDFKCDETTTQCCDGVCVPFDDPTNCGGCESETDADNTCTGTEGCCDDGTGQLEDFKCIELTASIDHCGMCENECTGVDDACCDGICTDTNTDFNHCGDCLTACDATAGDRCCQPNDGDTGPGICIQGCGDPCPDCP